MFYLLTKKELLYGTWSSAQCYVAAWRVGEFGEEWIHVHMSWVFIGRTDAEAETPILWPPHVKSLLIGKDPDAGRD